MCDVTYYVARNEYGVPECPLKNKIRWECQLDSDVVCPGYDEGWNYPEYCPLKRGKIIIIRED